MDIIRETIQTYDKIASAYCAKTRQATFLEWEEKYIKKLLSYVSIPCPLILDVGCGDARHCAMIENNGGKAIGIDLSENMLRESRRMFPSGDFRKMDMRQLLFDNDFFNGIWSSGSIYHVTKAQVRTVISEFARTLKPGGVVALNFKLGTGEGMECNPKSYGGFPRYFAYYTEQEMKELFEHYDFGLLESCGFPEMIFGDNIRQMWFRFENKP